MVAAVVGCAAAPSLAQVSEGNIQTRLRPGVTILYPDLGGTLTERTAVGIFDSGDTRETFSKETASELGVGLQNVGNRGAGAVQTIVSGGWLGGLLDPAERNTSAADATLGTRAGDPAHIFTSADTARTATVTGNSITPYIRDYNNRFSEDHNSMVFVTRADPAQNLVTMIDPINASPLPFAYDNTNAGNGRGLLPAGLPLDQYSSSVTYLANDDSRVPVPGINDNPGFVRFIPLSPVELGSTTLTPAIGGVAVNPALAVDRQVTLTISNADAANFDHFVLSAAGFGAMDLFYRPADAAGNAFGTNVNFEVQNAGIAIGGQVNPNGVERRDGSVRVVVQDQAGNVVAQEDFALPSQAPRPEGSIVIPALGINTGASALIDTGAPDTTPGDIVGTDVLNRFGQFFDFANSRLTLIGPEDPAIREMRGNGILFNVDKGSEGLARTAVEQEALYGSIPQLQGNPAAGTGAATIDTAGIPAPESVTYRTHLTGSNASYVDPFALDVRRGTVVNSLSLGADPIAPKVRLLFSVDEPSIGQPGSDVAVQNTLHQHQSDIFDVPVGQPNPSRAALLNGLVINQEVMGLGPNYGPMADAVTPSFDNLRDFDLWTQDALPGQALSNLDSPIMQQNDAGTADRPRVGSDRLGINFDMYFSIEDSQDIFRSDLGNIFARGFEDIGLSANFLDDIDALALYRPTVGPGVIGSSALMAGLDMFGNVVTNPANGNLVFDPNTSGFFSGIDMFHGNGPTDLALFSLSPDSVTLQALGLSAADIFITDFDGTFSLFASAQSLGLEFTDNIDGLDSRIVPEPPTGLLLLTAFVGMGAAARRRRVQRL